MARGLNNSWRWTLALGLLLPAIAGFVTPHALRAEPAGVPEAPTFTRDVAPILQRSCENCHRADGVAPMSLSTYEDVRPWARAIKQRTGIGPKAGVMPPWYVEKNIGIQQFHNDPSLSDDEIAMIAKWADTGAPRGNPADMPPPRKFDDSDKWHIGKPDLIVSMPRSFEVKPEAADWWGNFTADSGLTEDRYIKAVEAKPSPAAIKVVHHAVESLINEDGSDGGGTLVEYAVGKNGDIFTEGSGKLMKAGEWE